MALISQHNSDILQLQNSVKEKENQIIIKQLDSLPNFSVNVQAGKNFQTPYDSLINDINFIIAITLPISKYGKESVEAKKLNYERKNASYDFSTLSTKLNREAIQIWNEYNFLSKETNKLNEELKAIDGSLKNTTTERGKFIYNLELLNEKIMLKNIKILYEEKKHRVIKLYYKILYLSGVLSNGYPSITTHKI